MIKLDIAKALPPNTFNYFVGVVPGLFFELSLLYGNPDVLQRAINKADGIHLGYYTRILIALLMAYIIGTAFILSVGLLQRLIFYIQRLWIALRKAFVLYCLQPLIVSVFFNKTKKAWRYVWANRLHNRLISRAFPSDARRVYRCLTIAMRELLQIRFGIDWKDAIDQETWDVWSNSVGRLRSVDFRGDLSTMAYHATGWAGLVALSLAPALQNRYYIGLCSLLVAFGLLHDWAVQGVLAHPFRFALLRVYAALRELEEARKAKNLKAEDEDDKALGASVD